jgi:CheY-like chemotaxis protein
VVEDNVINVRVLCELLRRRGLEVEISDNGSDGFQQAMAAAGSDRAFDLILLDMYMPIQDGFTTARKLKEAGNTAPVVALTASAMAEDQRRCLDAGCDAYLAKPIDNALLDALLLSYLEMAPTLEP